MLNIEELTNIVATRDIKAIKKYVIKYPQAQFVLSPIAAQVGRFDVLKWARLNDLPINKMTVIGALMTDQQFILEWLQNQFNLTYDNNDVIIALTNRKQIYGF